MASLPTANINITDTELLLCINRLRRAEDRRPIVALPLPYSFLTPEQRYNIYTRYDSEYRIHQRDKNKFLDYKYQIILNKTEHKLFVHNKARVARQQTQLQFLPLRNIAQQDLKYYFPSSRLLKPNNNIFVTDTDCKYITSVIQVTSGLSTQIRASHTFHLSISFNDNNRLQTTFTPPRSSSPQFFDPPLENKELEDSYQPILFKNHTLPKVYPDLSDIFQMSSQKHTPEKRPMLSAPKRPHSSSPVERYNKRTPSPPQNNSTIEFAPSKLSKAIDEEIAKSNFGAYRTSYNNFTSTDTIVNPFQYNTSQNVEGAALPSDPPPQYIATHRYPPQSTGAIPKGTPPETGAIPRGTPPQDNNKDQLLEEAQKATRLLVQQNSELRNSILMLKMRFDNLQLQNEKDPTPAGSPKRTSPFPTPTPPISPTPSVQKQPSLVNFTPAVLPDAKEMKLIALQSQMTELTKMFGSIKLQVENTNQKIETSKLTDAERIALFRLTKKAAPETSTLIYALAKPTNIIPQDEIREPPFLAILKGHAVAATIGIFDPDKNKGQDFRDIWDRILNYTKNYKLYAHEYVDLLMTVMKGEAGNRLNGMIREYKGNLNEIIEAIQDIYIPQHTIYDDVDELNKFKRLPNEHIKSVMRRASMIIERLSPTCTAAAWPERKYHLLVSLLKQLIDKRTFKQLHTKELEAAQIGIQLDLKEIIEEVSLYEAGQDLIPKQETCLAYNINSLQLTNHPEQSVDDIQKLQLQINSLLPKRPKVENRKFSSSNSSISSGGIKRPHPGSDRRSTAGSSHGSFYSRDSRNSRPSYNSQRRPDGRRDFKTFSSSDSNRSYSGVNKWLNSGSSNSSNSSRPILSTQKWRESRSKSRDNRSSSRGRSSSSYGTHPFSFRQSRSHSQNRSGGRYDNRNRSQSYGRSTSRNSQGSYRNYNNKQFVRQDHQYDKNGRYFKKSFGKGNNTVTMTFYQCKLCPKTHLEGTPCNSVQP